MFQFMWSGFRVGVGVWGGCKVNMKAVSTFNKVEVSGAWKYIHAEKITATGFECKSDFHVLVLFLISHFKQSKVKHS